MKNNRFYKRYAVKCSGSITDGKFQKTRFQLNNISACGININTDKMIDDAHLLTINFDLTGIQLPHIRKLKGFVTRRKLGHSDFNYSIRFLDLSYTEIVEIDEYLQYTYSKYNIPTEDSDMMFL